MSGLKPWAPQTALPSSSFWSLATALPKPCHFILCRVWKKMFWNKGSRGETKSPRCSNPAEHVGFLRAIHILSTNSFWGEVNRRPSIVGFYDKLKITTSMKEILRRQNLTAISPPRFSCFATRCVYWFLPGSPGEQIRNKRKSDGIT
jgi:hypothetical protein